MKQLARLPCPCVAGWKSDADYHLSDCPEAKKLRDNWTTPEWLTQRLPVVDIDPASNYRSTVKALKSCWLSRGEDGLAIPWWGSMFLNGPYSDMEPWMEKANDEWAAGHLTEAIFLVKLDPTTGWWKKMVSDWDEKSATLWLFHKRLQHSPPPRIKASTNNFASALVHWRRSRRGGVQAAEPLFSLVSHATPFTAEF